MYKSRIPKIFLYLFSIMILVNYCHALVNQEKENNYRIIEGKIIENYKENWVKRSDTTDSKNEDVKDKNFFRNGITRVIIVIFIIFLLMLFVFVYHFASKQKNKMTKEDEYSQNSKKHSSNKNSNGDKEKNIYNNNLKIRNNKLITEDDTAYYKNLIIDQFKANDSFIISGNSKKEYDITGSLSTSFQKTPQSASTLINKSFSSNNFTDKGRLSERSSGLNSSYGKNNSGIISSTNDNSFYNAHYRKNSAGAISSPNQSESLYYKSRRKNSAGAVSSSNDKSYYNNSPFQDYNNYNSYNYQYSSDTKGNSQRFNTSTTTTVSSSSITSPASVYKSIYTQKATPIETPIFSQSHRRMTSNSNPYKYDKDENNAKKEKGDNGKNKNEDDMSTISFDDGVLKVTSFKNNKESIIYSYSEDLDSSSECILNSPSMAMKYK